MTEKVQRGLHLRWEPTRSNGDGAAIAAPVWMEGDDMPAPPIVKNPPTTAQTATPHVRTRSQVVLVLIAVAFVVGLILAATGTARAADNSSGLGAPTTAPANPNSGLGAPRTDAPNPNSALGSAVPTPTPSPVAPPPSVAPQNSSGLGAPRTDVPNPNSGLGPARAAPANPNSGLGALRTDAPNQQSGLGAIPAPTNVPPPLRWATAQGPPPDVTGGLGQLFGNLLWFAAAAAIIGLLISGARLALAHHHGTGEPLARVGVVLVGCVLVAIAVPVVETLL